jgi:hypothetical protein
MVFVEFMPLHKFSFVLMCALIFYFMSRSHSNFESNEFFSTPLSQSSASMGSLGCEKVVG